MNYERCPTCLSKPSVPGTMAHTIRAQNLWMMDVGFNEKCRETARLLYCGTCGARKDPRRKILKTRMNWN